jgi:hypothetical protein
MNTSTSRNLLSSLARRLGVAAILLAVATLGCSKGNKDKGTTLTGKVSTRDGLLKGGQMRFQPVAGGIEYPASITSEGTYTVSGLPQGEMKVSVDTEMIKSTAYPAPPGAKTPELPTGAQQYVAVPEKYRNLATTTLRVTVTGKKQEKDFDLAP